MVKLQFLLIAFTLIFYLKAEAQGVAINANVAVADQSAMLDISSTDKGVLIPRMTEGQKNSIQLPATGLMIYQTDGQNGFWYFNGTSWVQAIGPSGVAGAIGATGATGSVGATGPTGAAGTAASLDCVTVSGTQGKISSATCPPGYILTGGWYDHRDYNVASGGSPITVTESNGTFTVDDGGTTSYWVKAHARCCRLQ